MNKTEIKEARDIVEDKIERLESKMKIVFSPTAYGGETSYNNYDTIHGSRKEYDILKLGNELIRLKTLRDTYDSILNDEEIVIKEEEILSKLKDTKEKVRFLRVVQGYTQEVTADKLGLSTRTIQRIENIV